MFGFHSMSLGVIDRVKDPSSIPTLLTVWLQQGRSIRLAQAYLYMLDIESKGVTEAQNEVHSLGKKSKQLSRVWIYQSC